MRRMRSQIQLRWLNVLVAFVVVSVCIEAATTGRKSTLAQRTGTGSRNKNRRVMEPAFEHAGQSAGLEIWRIENFKPVAYPKNDYGKFYTGDSYIVLYTKDNKGVLSWDIHFWLGKETTQDEKGAAAILTVTLDDQLGGGPVQYREVQNHESQLFLSRFKSGVRYLPGGVASGFTQVDRDAFETRLFQVKGQKNIRVKQVDVSIASMNKGDCFILDVGKTIYVYVGLQSKRIERIKAISAANQIRDQDHSGRSKIIIVDEFSSDSEIDEYFEKLGSGSKDDMPDESSGGSDDEFEADEERGATLYRVSDASGTLKIDAIQSKPLEQSALDTNDCFILETADANIYVWVGKKCNNREKSESMNKAQHFIQTKNYPNWTRVQRIVEQAEPATFQQYFRTWKSAGELRSRLIRSTDGEEREQSRLEMKSAGEAPEFMPDDGTGDVEIFRIEDFELVPVDPENYGQFFGGDSYVIKYGYGGNKWIIYMWQGNTSSIDEKASSAIHAVNMDNELSGKATQIRVSQGHEPRHFLHIFKGKMIVFLGGRASGFKNVKENDTYVEGETRIYRIRGTTELNVRAIQELPRASTLQSDDVFIVENDANSWVWCGSASDEIERNLATTFLDILVPGSEPITLEEGGESADFWDALGGKTPYKKTFESELKPLSERLYHASVKKNSKKVKFEDVSEFTQEDLVEDDVMVLDATNQVYIWNGNGSSENERKLTFQFVQNYLKSKNRSTTILLVIKQGQEPQSFIKLFPSWDENLWDNVESYASIKSRLQEQNNTIDD